MEFNNNNPLALLFSGPLDEIDLSHLGVSLMPDSNYWEMLDHILHLITQYRENPQNILTPHWWRESPEKFRDEMNDELNLGWHEDLTEEDKQRFALEILLNMWSKFLFG